MAKKNQQYYRIDTGKLEGVYELADIGNIRQDKKERVLCPCCNKPIRAHADVIQWGFWQDVYTTFFICKPCVKAWRYSYIQVCEVTQITAISDAPAGIEADAPASV